MSSLGELTTVLEDLDAIANRDELLLLRTVARNLEVDAREREGVVVSVGAAWEHSLGGLLAHTTSREHYRSTVEALPALLAILAREPCALVIDLRSLDRLALWPGFLHENVGILTGRGVGGAFRHVVANISTRSKTGADLRLVDHSFPSSHAADAVTVQDLRAHARKGRRVFSLLGHGRDCCISMPDGVVCGLSHDPYATDSPWRLNSTRMSPCLQGAGCFREGLDKRDRLEASSYEAEVVLAISCNVITVGANAGSHATNLALAFLEGGSRSVIGSVGTHVPDVEADEIVRRRIAEGLALGRIVAELNERGQRANGPYGRLGLLGDPGYISYMTETNLA